MKIDSLLLLAEYFAGKKEISFCLMYEDESAGRTAKNLALFLDTDVVRKGETGFFLGTIRDEIRGILKKQAFGIVCLNDAEESLRHKVIESSTPVFCRDERPMREYCRKVYREDLSHQKKFKFTDLSGISLLLAL